MRVEGFSIPVKTDTAAGPAAGALVPGETVEVEVVSSGKNGLVVRLPDGSTVTAPRDFPAG